ncbi:MAG: hypothetical protein WCO03_02360 [bacterium]
MIASQYKVAIIGAGEIGQAIGGVIRKNCSNVEFWDVDSSKVEGQRMIMEVINGVNILFLCVPSWGMRKAVQDIYPHLSQDTIVVSLAKGMEEETHKTMEELLLELLPGGQKFALLGGPMIAEEISKDLRGYAEIATSNYEVYEKISALFVDTNITASYSDDVKGVALAGILKNIFTLAVGLEEYYDFGVNARGWLVSQCVSETEKAIVKLGGKTETAHGLAGLGDFLATAFSKYSRNRQAIEGLASTGEIKLRSEGTVSLESLIYRLGGEVSGYPVLHTLGTVLLDQAKPKDALNNLING